MEMVNATKLYQRRIIRDLTPCDEVEEVFSRFGLTPSGPETEALEHRDSHTRMALVEPYENQVDAMAQICAEVVINTMFEESDLIEMGPDEVLNLRTVYTAMISTGTAAIMANIFQDAISGNVATAMQSRPL